MLLYSIGVFVSPRPAREAAADCKHDLKRNAKADQHQISARIGMMSASAPITLAKDYGEPFDQRQHE